MEDKNEAGADGDRVSLKKREEKQGWKAMPENQVSLAELNRLDNFNITLERRTLRRPLTL